MTCAIHEGARTPCALCAQIHAVIVRDIRAELAELSSWKRIGRMRKVRAASARAGRIRRMTKGDAVFLTAKGALHASRKGRAA